jgi:hypothetical protein
MEEADSWWLAARSRNQGTLKKSARDTGRRFRGQSGTSAAPKRLQRNCVAFPATFSTDRKV